MTKEEKAICTHGLAILAAEAISLSANIENMNFGYAKIEARSLSDNLKKWAKKFGATDKDIVSAMTAYNMEAK